MRQMIDVYSPPPELVLGTSVNSRVPKTDQERQGNEVREILNRLRTRPGVVLADEVGMGKTFVALGVAYSIAIRSPRGPVIVMVPANLVNKWEQDFRTFCELYLKGEGPVRPILSSEGQPNDVATVRYGIARHSIELMKLLDDPPKTRCRLIFLAQGAMARRQSDKWIRLALIAEALRRHARGGATRLILVRKQIHRFLAQLIWAMTEERANDWGEELWQELLRTDPEAWRETYNGAVRDEHRRLVDDPVPKAVLRALRNLDPKRNVDLKPLANALAEMPIRAAGGKARVAERIKMARDVLHEIEQDLWKVLLAQAKWQSPLLVMDEAHHLKNPATALARQFQSPDLDRILRTGDGAMAGTFDRMLFLTATPFQLGHEELVRVLERFGDVRWNSEDLGDRDGFQTRMAKLGLRLTESQRTAIGLQKSWSQLRPEECREPVDAWWEEILAAPRDSLTYHQRSVVDSFEAARGHRAAAEEVLQPWIIRHNKGGNWTGTSIQRRQRLEGARIREENSSWGLPVPPEQLLPFFLAARSAVRPGKDLLGEALCSSYEAFRFTRKNGQAGKDEDEAEPGTPEDLASSKWYLDEFDRSLEKCSGSPHPKVSATVERVVDLWEAGEKVLVFAFYLKTCSALRRHISREIERRILLSGDRNLRAAGIEGGPPEVERRIERVQTRYFDDADGPGRRAIDGALEGILQLRTRLLDESGISAEQRETLKDVMRRFLRVSTTLARCFPLARLDSITPAAAVASILDAADSSGMSWRQKFEDFLKYLAEECSTDERSAYLEAASRTQTGGIRVEGDDSEDPEPGEGTVTLANVQVATGRTKRETRARLMRAFNTPFFPDILVCSEVMGEGVDLQRFCRIVVHHDLAWNPSTIEQRTGRIDRIGCKAEKREQPITVYLPYLAGAADERQYRVMTDRERWFRIVMGQEEVARLIAPESEGSIPLPERISEDLSFDLGLDGRRKQ